MVEFTIRYVVDYKERRAKAVYDYFLNKGVAGDCMKTISYGEAKPEMSNLTREGRAINRRVVIQVVE
jgi:OOP family OmpA-OmpF porin